MLEAKLQEAVLLKKLIDSIKELVTDANFECNEDGIHLQAMDNSHVALVSVRLDADGFRRYRCDRPMPLGVNLGALMKVLKCAKDDDVCTLRASDDVDNLNLTYEARNSDRLAEYQMKLMDIDTDSLGIPDTDYDARVTMPSSELTRIVRDLSGLGESVKIEVSKEGVRFVAEGESANGSILLKQTEGARERYRDYGKSKVKREDNEDGDEDDDEEEGKAKAKKEKIKKEEDVEMEDEEEDAKKSDDGEEEVPDDEDEEESSTKKRKKAPAKSSKPAKKQKKSEEQSQDAGVNIEMNQHVALTFSLKYMNNFVKSASLSDTVQLMMSNDVPLLVSYHFNTGFIRYYLAPKIGDD